MPVKIVTIQPYVGLNFSFLANANYKAEASSAFGAITQEKDNKSDFETFDFGVLFGGDIFFNITKNIFVSADIRFELNFLRIDKGRDDDIFNGTFYALFGAGYKF